MGSFWCIIAMIVLSLDFAIAIRESGNELGSMQREWYLVALKGIDMLLKIGCSLEGYILSTFPCIILGALTIFAPKAAPIA